MKSYETHNKLKPIILGAHNFEDNVPFRGNFGDLMTKDVLSFSMGFNISDTRTGLLVVPVQSTKKKIKPGYYSLKWFQTKEPFFKGSFNVFSGKRII